MAASCRVVYEKPPCDQSLDALYALLNELADRVDDGSASYAEVMVKMWVSREVADSIANLIRGTGTSPDVREVRLTGFQS